MGDDEFKDSNDVNQVFECAGVLNQHLVVQPDGVGSAIHNKMTRIIKEKYSSNKR